MFLNFKLFYTETFCPQVIKIVYILAAEYYKLRLFVCNVLFAQISGQYLICPEGVNYVSAGYFQRNTWRFWTSEIDFRTHSNQIQMSEDVMR